MRAHQPGSTPIDIPETVPNPAYTPRPLPTPERGPIKVPEKVPEKQASLDRLPPAEAFNAHLIVDLDDLAHLLLVTHCTSF